MTEETASLESSDETLPLLPLKDMVVFPRMVVPLLVGREASLAAVEESLASGRPLFLCAQRDSQKELPEQDDLYDVGVAAQVVQTLRMPDGTMKVVVEGLGRAKVTKHHVGPDFSEVSVSAQEIKTPKDKSSKALVRLVRSQFEEYVKLGQRIAPEVAMSMDEVEDADALADLICAHLTLTMKERQELLEKSNPRARLNKMSQFLIRENDMFEMEREVRDKVRNQMERGQREYYLHEQLKSIQQELGLREDEQDEFTELRELIAKAKMPEETTEKALRELGRYERMPPMSPEGSVIRTYIEWMTDLPWRKKTKDKLDLVRAKKILDEDHYGLEKVKDRILEFLAVRKLSKSTKGPVLCLVGAPGVGKTSLGRSIARAIGRKFVRVSLGGIRDEAEIRGHRRTYIGAMPGRIIQSMKKAEVVNPLFMLDEIDKMSDDYRGDPSSALLEVLDPEQNKNFNDHYMEVDYDLHEVFFITTANSEYDIPEPLLDRMEIVRMSGYTLQEKECIANQFLIKRQMKECGITKKHIEFTPEGLDTIVNRYTHEAGVRDLERQIATLCRKTARDVVTKKSKAKKKVITKAEVINLLGPPVYSDWELQTKPHIGVATGLAWTVAGGDVLTIETTVMKGKGGLQLTGQLGEVMQESAQAAYTYLRAHAEKLKITTQFWKNSDIHIHVPEGAIPKDGPSAGIAMALSLLSALKKKAPQAKMAVTGEITLQGRVLSVGGIKEKMIAARRAEMTTVVIPKENENDLIELPKEVRDEMEFILVETLDEALAALLPQPKRRRK